MNGFLFWERSISETNVKEILRLRSFCSRSYDNLNFTLAFELCSGQSAEQGGSRWILLPVYLWGIPAALGGWPHSRPGFWPFELRREGGCGLCALIPFCQSTARALPPPPVDGSTPLIPQLPTSVGQHPCLPLALDSPFWAGGWCHLLESRNCLPQSSCCFLRLPWGEEGRGSR